MAIYSKPFLFFTASSEVKILEIITSKNIWIIKLVHLQQKLAAQQLMAVNFFKSGVVRAREVTCNDGHFQHDETFTGNWVKGGLSLRSRTACNLQKTRGIATAL